MTGSSPLKTVTMTAAWMRAGIAGTSLFQRRGSLKAAKSLF
ncbi:hypothetical protein CASFOL_004783 [Castilleja foliolosa]|uniref:Uncharacterized protein n=1 Tax=Castilleja foliolosa TaxID=1961234 RepID=A0ABD3EC97_9LAMI